MRFRTLSVCFFTFLLLVSVAPVFAQKETGVILGEISDPDKAALPGVTITVSSPAMIGGSSTTYTDKEGHYRFPALPPGVYTVAAELQGFQKVIRKDIRLYVGNSVTIDLSLEAEKISETVEVKGEAPLIDKTTAATSNTVPLEAVENLPKFSFALDLFTLTPGVGADYVAYGAAGSSANAYWLDGVDVSDPEGGTPWLFPNYNWLQEVQVVGIGAPAEYGGFTGVVTNSITRSGGNEFHGLAETFFSNDSLTSTNIGSLPVDVQDTVSPGTQKKFSDNTLQMGGPFKRDKVWFFLSGQYQLNDTIPFGYLDTATDREPRLFGKVTWKVNENNTFQGFSEWDRYDLHGRDADVNHPTEVTTLTERAPEYSWNGTWISLLTPNSVLDARFSGFWGYYHLYPFNGPNVSAHFDPVTNIFTENNTNTYLADRWRTQANVSLTHYARNFIHGDHDFKFGVEFERSDVKSKYYYNGGIYYYDYGGQPYYRYLWDGYNINTPLHRTSSYAQDSWDVTKKLNLNLGVRWDHNRGIIGDVTDTDGTVVKGLGTVYKTDPVAPRLGFTFDVKGDQKTVVKGHYGRYYEAMFSDYFAPVSKDWGGYTGQYFYNGTWYTASFTPHNYTMDPKIRQPYIDQYTIGVDQEIGHIAVGAHYIHRTWHDIIDGVNVTGQYVTTSMINPITGQPITVFSQTNDPANDAFLQTNPKAFGDYPQALFRKYDAVELIANRRMSQKLYVSGSFVWSRALGNANNGSYTATGSNTGLFSRLFNDPNYNINTDGKLTNDPTYEIKFQGTYALPWGINTAWYYLHSSGDTWTPRIRTPSGLLNQGRIRLLGEPRGSERLPAQNTVDIRAEKEFPIGKGALRFTMDVFNLFNTGYPTDVEDRFENDAFGQAIAWTDPRSIRFAVRYTF